MLNDEGLFYSQKYGEETMSNMQEKQQPAPPEIGPYFFPVILAIMGVWCFYDGWLTSNPDMQEYLLFNRIVSGILLPWALLDFLRTRRFVAQEKTADSAN
jgi:hypothetical protein